MLFTLAISTAGMALVLLGLLATLDVPPDQPLVAAILLSFLELTVVVAVAVFFSAFTTPLKFSFSSSSHWGIPLRTTAS